MKGKIKEEVFEEMERTMIGRLKDIWFINDIIDITTDKTINAIIGNVDLKKAVKGLDINVIAPSKDVTEEDTEEAMKLIKNLEAWCEE